MLKKINVLHLVYSFNTGGAEKLILNMLENKFLNEKINNHFIIITGEADEYLKNRVLSSNIKSLFFPKNQYKNRLKTLLILFKYIKENNIELIHIHEGSSEKWAMLLKLFFPKLKIVHTCHDTKILFGFSFLKLCLIKIITDKVVAVSKSVFEECQILSLNNSVHIDNGIDLKIFKEKTHLNNKDSLNIINVSRLTLPKKGQDVLIKALGECKRKGLNFTCQIVGSHSKEDDEVVNILSKLVKTNKLENEIVFLGNRTDIPDLLSQADLFILPSRYEGLPLVLLEAMASGLPVIASNIISNKNLIKNDINGILFENENYEDLAAKIIELNYNREKMKQIAKEGYCFVQDFDITKMCQNYYKVYDELCEK